MLVASKAPEPSDIQWENLECTLWQRMWRHIATDVVKYLLLILGKTTSIPAKSSCLTAQAQGDSWAAAACVARDRVPCVLRGQRT